MRDFSWKYFSMTGDVDAYLLYKQMNEQQPDELEAEEGVQFFEEESSLE